MRRGGSFLLDGLEVVRQASDALGDLPFVRFGHGSEQRSPDGHFGGAVIRHLHAAAQHAFDIGVRKLPLVALGESGQVGRRFRKGRVGWRRASSLAVISVAEGAVLLEERGAGWGSSVFLLCWFCLRRRGAGRPRGLARLKAAPTKARAETGRQAEQQAWEDEVANGPAERRISPCGRLRVRLTDGKSFADRRAGVMQSKGSSLTPVCRWRGRARNDSNWEGCGMNDVAQRFAGGVARG